MPEPSKTQRQPLSFTATDWKDDKAGGTPITAAQLNRVEKGIADAVRGVNDINTRIMSYLVQSDGEHATQDANGAAIVPPCYIMDWSTKTTWFDNGTDPRFTPFATADEAAKLRDSLSRFESRFETHGTNGLTVVVTDNGDCQLRVQGVNTWLCWNHNDVFTWNV